MPGKKLSMGLRALAVFAVTLLVTSSWAATNWHERVLHNFDGSDGTNSRSPLTLGAAGNLFGTTSSGGTYNYGTVFELTPTSGGGWSETVLHNFNNDGVDGWGSQSGLIFDAAGNLYGTTTMGGTYDMGTVFELSPAQGGGWTETILYSFGSGTDGAYPYYSGVIFDAAGNLYGTTSSGGTHNCQGNGGCGTVFMLTPAAGGAWTETVLYNFGNGTDDGYAPYSGLVRDAAGNLFGTALYGGPYSCLVAQFEGCGTAFELSPAAGGGWTETVIHNFGSGTDGSTPIAGITFDAAGNLYGTTNDGGAYTYGGTVFQLSPAQGGGWTETLLYSFSQQGSSGYGPNPGQLVFDAAGNLYGAVYDGGADEGGTAFKLTPTVGGGWTETLLYNFGYDSGPWGGLILDAAGHLYGTSPTGGTNQCGQMTCGTVFELTPIDPCITCSHAVMR